MHQFLRKIYLRILDRNRPIEIGFAALSGGACFLNIMISGLGLFYCCLKRRNTNEKIHDLNTNKTYFKIEYDVEGEDGDVQINDIDNKSNLANNQEGASINRQDYEELGDDKQENQNDLQPRNWCNLF